MNFPSIGGAYPYKCHSEQYQDKVECLGAQIPFLEYDGTADEGYDHGTAPDE